uniref:Uncharacterized protein n=1 Tax=Timema monikensis TaxID=170555 RepID=A0A7R9ELC4_9NEOP|nr:unnamed protein product [Timema monikensis]
MFPPNLPDDLKSTDNTLSRLWSWFTVQSQLLVSRSISALPSLSAKLNSFLLKSKEIPYLDKKSIPNISGELLRLVAPSIFTIGTGNMGTDLPEASNLLSLLRHAANLRPGIKQTLYVHPFHA